MRPRLSVQEVAPAVALVAWAVVGPLVSMPGDFEPNVWTYVIGVTVSASFAVRRLAPLPVGVLMMSGFALLALLEAFPSGLGIGEVALVLGAYTIEAHRRVGPSLPVVAPAIGAVLFVLAEWGHREEVGFFMMIGPSTYVWFGALVAAGTAAGWAFRDRTGALEEQRRQVDELRTTAPAEAVARIEAERLRMAADIEAVVHGLVQRIRPAVSEARGTDRARVEGALDEVGTQSRSALRELRTLLLALRVAGDENGADKQPRPSADVSRSVERVLRERPLPPGAGPWRRDRAALWIPVILFVAAGVAERIALPPLPVQITPTITLPAPDLGEAAAYAALVISALLFLLRERAPVPMSILVGVVIAARSADGSLNGLQPTRDLLVAAAAFFVALHLRRIAAAVVAAAPAVAGWFIGRSFDPVPLGETEAITFAAVVIAAFVSGRSLRRPFQRAIGAAAERDELRREQAQLEARVRAHERMNVARELHDIVGHGLTLLAITAGSGRARLAAGETVRHLAQELDRELAATLAELDSLRAVLGAGDAPEPGEDTEWPERLVVRAAAAGAHVDADLRLDPVRLPAGVATVARRILEEAVTNAHKHGDGGRVRLRAAEVDGELRLLVENSVGGAAVLDGSNDGMGVRGMQERARLYGGMLTVTPGDASWSVEAALPLAGTSLERSMRLRRSSVAAAGTKDDAAPGVR